jgi:hypothetical protein
LSWLCTTSPIVLYGGWAGISAFTVVPGAMPACFSSALAFFGLYLMPFTAVLSKNSDDGGTGEIDGSPVPASAPLLMSSRLTAYCNA